MVSSSSSAMRKGAWTAEEDNLLRKCIHKYGEGKWHLVPFRAGLNRCRKSCRLRWLNYLRPDIKRGDFSLDEVDLILRLHKLLGNRWSLIAGRIPGRTANDVKNYWNTHIQKKAFSMVFSTQNYNNNYCKRKSTEITPEINAVIKPRPTRFKNTTTTPSPLLISAKPSAVTVNTTPTPSPLEVTALLTPSAAPSTNNNNNNNNNNNSSMFEGISMTSSEGATSDDIVQWWNDWVSDSDVGTTSCMNEVEFGWSDFPTYDIDTLELLN